MPVHFSAETDVANSAGAVAALCPRNPFATYTYVQAMAGLGFTPWLFALYDETQLAAACYGYLRAGRINRALLLPSLPEAPDWRVFWEGLLAFCYRAKVTRLDVNTCASSCYLIPQLPGEVQRTQRFEYLLQLQDKDLWHQLHENHRRRVRKAQKAGVEIRGTTDPKACGYHAQLMTASMQRRSQRGEKVANRVDDSEFCTFLSRSAGRIFQAVYRGQVVSSILLLLAERGAYLQSGGTSPEGMELGASHLLHHEAARALQTEGLEVYNLGGARASQSGLALFKSRFGATARELESAQGFVGSGVRTYLARLTYQVRLWSAALKHGSPAPDGSSPVTVSQFRGNA